MGTKYLLCHQVLTFWVGFTSAETQELDQASLWQGAPDVGSRGLHSRPFSLPLDRMDSATQSEGKGERMYHLYLWITVFCFSDRQWPASLLQIPSAIHRQQNPPHHYGASPVAELRPVGLRAWDRELAVSQMLEGTLQLEWVLFIRNMDSRMPSDLPTECDKTPSPCPLSSRNLSLEITRENFVLEIWKKDGENSWSGEEYYKLKCISLTIKMELGMSVWILLGGEGSSNPITRQHSSQRRRRAPLMFAWGPVFEDSSKHMLMKMVSFATANKVFYYVAVALLFDHRLHRESNKSYGSPPHKLLACT